MAPSLNGPDVIKITAKTLTKVGYIPQRRPSAAQIVLYFQVEVMVVTLFSTPESGIIIQDSFSPSLLHDRLVGLQVPYFYFTKKVSLKCVIGAN